MRTRRMVAMTGALAGLIAIALIGSVTSAQGPAVPKTPWGDPDLQGTFSSEAELSVPFERQAQYGDRRFLNDAEYAQRRAQADKQTRVRQRRLRPRDRRSLERRRGRLGHISTAALARARQSVAPHVAGDRSARRPAAAARAAAPGRTRPAERGGTFAGRHVRRHADLQWAGGSQPVGALHQPRHAGRDLPHRLQRQPAHRAGPGCVAITYEMIHDTRVIPIDGRRARRHGDPRHTSATRAAIGKATRSSWTSTNFSEKTNLPRRARDAAHHRALHARGDGLSYEVTVDDPQTWTKPWTAALTSPTAGRHAVRVRVPRGQQLDAQHPQRVAGRGEERNSLYNVGRVLFGPALCQRRRLLRTGPQRRVTALLRRARDGFPFHRVREEADHHLFPRLIAPADRRRRIRIVPVRRRVVEVRARRGASIPWQRAAAWRASSRSASRSRTSARAARSRCGRPDRWRCRSCPCRAGACAGASPHVHVLGEGGLGLNLVIRRRPAESRTAG